MALTNTRTPEWMVEPLRCGLYEEGWRRFEARSSRVDAPYMRCGIPEWQGEPISSRRIVVVGEQGIGDEVHFGRFIRP